jgi:hypothetical protein
MKKRAGRPVRDGPFSFGFVDLRYGVPVTHDGLGFAGDCPGRFSGVAKLFSNIFQKVLAWCGGRCYSSPPADATHEAKLKNRATKMGEAGE